MELTINKIKKLVSKYFPDINNNEIEIFLSITKYQVVKNKELILKSGRTDKHLIFILKGVARAYSINESGIEFNDYLRAEGHLMGDARLFGDDTQILNIEALSEIHFLIFDISKLEALGFENQKLMVFYLNFLKEIILTLSHRLHTFVAMDSKERYLDLIRWNPIYLKSTYDKHIASFIGITPLTLHRIKKKIKPIK